MTSSVGWIGRLELQPHPEGGFFRESYRAAGCFAGHAEEAFPAGRSHSTAIYFLLERGDFSAFHRIRSDEIWHFYDGDGLDIHLIDAKGAYRCLHLGLDASLGQLPQAVVPAGCWFACEVADRGDFALLGCSVAPGFDFSDFELATAKQLASLFPSYQPLIRRMTRS